MKIIYSAFFLFISLNLFAQDLLPWSERSDKGVHQLAPHIAVLNDHVFISQQDLSNNTFIYKLDLSGKVVDSLAQGTFGGVRFLDEMEVDPADSTIWMIGYANDLVADSTETYPFRPKAAYFQMDENLNLIRYKIIDTIGGFTDPSLLPGSYSTGVARASDRIFMRYELFNVNTLSREWLDLVMDTSGQVLHINNGDNPFTYYGFDLIGGRLFGAATFRFWELDLQTLEPIKTYDWVNTRAYDYGDWQFINSTNTRPYFLEYFGNIAFANTINNVNRLDTLYHEIEIRDTDFNLIRRKPIHGLFNETPGQVATQDFRLATYNPMDFNAEGEIFLLGYDLFNADQWRLTKTDSNLNIIWSKNLELEQRTFADHVIALPDGGCLLSGTYAFAPGTTDRSLVQILYKFDASGNMTTSTRLPAIEMANFKVFPNPATARLNLQLPADEFFHVRLYSQTGQLLYQADQQRDTLELDVSRYANGTYILNLLDENGQLKGIEKIVVKH
ncbi:MAG: T9SS type A sorting domain-containing protein [Bacteroidota bacterium]